MITRLSHSLPFFAHPAELGRLWHSANGIRGGRTGRFGLTFGCHIKDTAQRRHAIPL